MQHTQNYQLSRWEKDDRIMMEDFNADNAKLDAALSAKADAEDVTALAETVAALTASAFALSAASMVSLSALKSSIMMRSSFSQRES